MKYELKYITSVFIPIILFISAYIIQTKLFLEGDVAYLLEVSGRLFAGGKYGRDILETNPPMILYLYLPVFLFAKLTAINIITTVRVYIFLLAISSLSVCFFLLKKLLHNNCILYCMFYFLIFDFLLLPATQFGQREHILILFMMPYLFATALELEGQSLHPIVACVIGLFAGLGFALKPFFVLTPLLVELYCIFVKKNIWVSFRIEPMMILGVLIIYLGSVFVFQPEYIHIILPLISSFYFIGMSNSWFAFLNAHTGYIILSVLTYFLFYKIDHYRYFNTILVLSIITMTAAFVIPQMPWYYHVMPAVSLVCLLFANYFGQIVSSVVVKKTDWIRNYSYFLFCGLILFFIPIWKISISLAYNIHYKQTSPMSRLITYINTIPNHHSILCLSANVVADCFPLVYHTNSVYGGRFPFFWWLRGELILTMYPYNKPLAPSLKSRADYLFNSMVDDINYFRNNIIIINKNNLKENIGPEFDLIAHFSKHKNFRDAWQHYHYLTTVDCYEIYQRQG